MCLRVHEVSSNSKQRKKLSVNLLGFFGNMARIMRKQLYLTIASQVEASLILLRVIKAIIDY